jgi:hypothetical protein
MLTWGHKSTVDQLDAIATDLSALQHEGDVNNMHKLNNINTCIDEKVSELYGLRYRLNIKSCIKNLALVVGTIYICGRLSKTIYHLKIDAIINI